MPRSCFTLDVLAEIKMLLMSKYYCLEQHRKWFSEAYMKNTPSAFHRAFTGCFNEA